jgi:hypothetical protein
VNYRSPLALAIEVLLFLILLFVLLRLAGKV